MDGRLRLTRVVRKVANNFEVINADGRNTLVSVDSLATEVTQEPLAAILCNDLLVLCDDPSDGRDPTGQVHLWVALRMQSVQQPVSIMHDSGMVPFKEISRIFAKSNFSAALRLVDVDNDAILYFDLPSMTEALTWSRGELFVGR
jgi:hypothetical protein